MEIFLRTKKPRMTFPIVARAASLLASLSLISASNKSIAILFIWACSINDKKTESRRAVNDPLLPAETRLTRRFALKPGLGMQGLLVWVVGIMNLR